MARIRTVKPEYWTDEVIVQLPFQARLLFIGIWNFADDHGAIEESPDRLRMQIFPADGSLNVAELIDLLVAANLLERFVDDEGKRVIQVRNWHKHQKVDNPAKSRILSDKYRKLAIPSEARRALAVKYGCPPGGAKDVACYFCGLPGRIHWWTLHDGRPSAWVVFDLELDHLEPEAIGGANTAENLVLSCRACNRGRRDKLALPWILSRMLAIPSDDSTTPRGSLLGREGKGREGKGKEDPPASSTPVKRKVFDPKEIPNLDPTAWATWVAYRAERKPAIKPVSMQAAAEQLAAFGSQQAEVVQHSKANGYQGLIAPKFNGHGATAAPKRYATADEIEAEELAREVANAQH